MSAGALVISVLLVGYFGMALLVAGFCFVMANSRVHHPIPDASAGVLLRNCILIGLCWPVLVPIALIREWMVR